MSAAGLPPGSLLQNAAWNARITPADIERLPACAAVYLLCGERGAPILLATTQHLRRAIQSRLAEPDEARRGRTDLAEIVRAVHWRQASCAFDARWWYYRLARELHPRDYRERIGFGPAWFLSVDWARPIPELRVTERIWSIEGDFLGPWPTHRAAQQSLETLWDLFDLCRYPEQVRRAPAGTRCAYADMGRCDAPCDGSAPLPAYIERCRAAWRFATGAMGEWLDAATARMKAAAAEMNFERAAQIKQQVAATRAWRASDMPLFSAEAMQFVLALPVTRRKAWALYLFRQGVIEAGPIVPDRKFAAVAAGWIVEQVRLTAPPTDALVRMEQTWLVAHLLGHREGQTALVHPLTPGANADTLVAALAALREKVAQRSSSESGEIAVADQESPADLVPAPNPAQTKAPGDARS